MSKTEKHNGEPQKQAPKNESTEKPVCGIIMPISAIADYPASHWAEVKSILTEVIEAAGFTANLVSDANEVSIIHTRIVGNISENPIMVCDISAKNPNVMFELGLRLAFDKPTIVIKDDATDYNFDTSPIEHLSYPRDLRYAQVLEFKERLKKKIVDTHEKGKDPEYSTFLKHFIKLKPKVDTVQEVSIMDYIQKQFEGINARLLQLSTSPAVVRGGIADRLLASELATREMIHQSVTDWASQGPIPSAGDESVSLRLAFSSFKDYLVRTGSKLLDLPVYDQQRLILPEITRVVNRHSKVDHG